MAKQDNPFGAERAEVLVNEPIAASTHRPPFLPVLVLYILIMALLIVAAPGAVGYSIENGILVFEWIFILIPCLIFVRVFHLNIVRDLKITGISARTVAGVFLASVSGIVLTGELVMVQNYVVPIPVEYMEIMRDFFTLSGRISAPAAFLIFAVTPAICEEFLFRGLILNGLLGKISQNRAIIVSGALFGLFHLDPYKLVGTRVLGFVMAYLTIRPTRLSASIVYHLINTSLILLVMNVPFFSNIPWLTDEAHVPAGILLLSAIVFLAGIRLTGPVTKGKSLSFVP